MKRLLTILAFLLTLTGVLLSSQCKRATAPAPAPSATVTIAIVGGLGASSPMNELRFTITRDFPTTNIVDFGDDNAYMVDVGTYLFVNAHGKIILLGHSKGAWAVCRAASFLQVHGIPVELMVLYDAVGVGSFSLTIAPNVKRCIHFKAGIPTLGIVRATLHGTYEEHVLAWTFHNDVPRHPDAIKETSAAIALVKGQP